VGFVLGFRGLSPFAAEALKTESDIGAAVEQARMLAHFSNGDSLLLDAWTRIGVDAGAGILFAVAGARGVEALRLLPTIRAAGARESTVGAFIQLATRGEQSATIGLASDALERRDPVLFAAVLTSTRDVRLSPSYVEQLAVKGLSPGVPREITFATIWYVLRTWNPAQPLAAALKSGFEQALESGHTPGDATELLALELAARAVGRPPGATPGWNDLVAKPPRTIIRPLVMEKVARALLNDSERETLLKELAIDPDSMRRPTPDEFLGTLPASDAASRNPPMRVASDFPVGFMSDIFRMTACNLADANKQGPGEAVLTFRPDGRVMHIALAPTKVSRGCADAVRVLMMTHVESVDRIPPQEARVLALFDTEFIACQDVPIARPIRIERDGPDARIQQPKKTRYVPPVYPQSAIDQRRQGVVLIDSMITATGCIARARVTRSVDPRLDWAALSAVTNWRFSPTFLNGTPVPVVMTVNVVFSLK
jgi:TonB family protein